MPKPPLELQTTTLWEYPSQHYGDGQQGDKNYIGATPSWIIWNLLQRYTKPKDLVVDPMAGSGTTLDVARDLSRRALGYDLQPAHKDVFRADARKLPLEDEKADFVFIDPPYSDHIKYSGRPECIGELSANEPAYYQSMETVIQEINRVLRPGHYMALYVSDSFEKDKAFHPIGFELFARLQQYFEPVDIITVVRHNAKLKKNNWHTAAAEGNFFLRGFNYLFIMRKPLAPKPEKPKKRPDRRGTWDNNARVETKKPRWDNRPDRQDRQDRSGGSERWEKPEGQEDSSKPGKFGRQDRQERPGGSDRWKKPDDRQESSSRPGQPVRQDRRDRPRGADRWERTERQGSSSKPGKFGRQDRQARPRGTERWEKPEGQGSSSKPGQFDRQDRQDKPRGTDRWEKPDRQGSSSKPGKFDRQGAAARQDRPDKPQGPNKWEKQDNTPGGPTRPGRPAKPGGTTRPGRPTKPAGADRRGKLDRPGMADKRGKTSPQGRKPNAPNRKK
ncbi:MAG: hypothetical protein JEZ02_08605 [Desulfatibacillum sp.]|nr:hypothetical protein [Desulfatibacillum sp.]